jgi:nitroimidazol reductase NimA-like FMN-containing flavoprotein (pyridoxamine 5'-phosphate oxidase superfamily)
MATSSSGEELTEDECLALLQDCEYGRLAVRSGNDGVDVFPVNFVIHQDAVLLRTGSGTKMDSVRSEPRVAFQADHLDHETGVAWSVVVKGDAAEVIDHDERFALLNVTIDTLDPHLKPHFIRLRPVSTTGRRFSFGPSTVDRTEY